MTAKLRTFLVAPAIALLFVLPGCAGVGGDPNTACVAFDASHSTRYIEPEYERILRERIEGVAEEGGRASAVVLTGKPGVEAIVRSEDFSDLTGEEEQGERSRAVRSFTARIADEAQQSLRGGENPTEGSGIVNGLNLLGGYGDCDSVLALSDGLETAAFHTEHAELEDPSARRQLVDRLRVRGLVPDLGGAALSFPLGGVLPQGTNIPAPVLAGLQSFWREYAHAADATLEWRGEG